MAENHSILYPTKRSPLFAAIMFAAFLLLVLIGLGVFQLESGPTTGSVHIGGRYAAESGNIATAPQQPILFQPHAYGTGFWVTHIIIASLALLLPYLRPVRASLAAVLTAALIILINYPGIRGENAMPLNFELVTVLALFSLYILLSFIGEIRDRQKLTAIFSQYIPPELVEQYSRDPNSISLEGEAREITVLFCDICDFTSISERLDPKTLAQWLNRYFSLISHIVVRHGGTLDKYIGDSVMAFWGAPVRSDKHASDALAAALDMQLGVEKLSETYQSEGLPDIRIGIGISTGIGNVGNLGSQYRMAYTVVGDTVNMAQRLERQTRHYRVPIIVSQKTAEQANTMLYRELDTVQVKGRDEYTHMFQPICPANNASPEMLENLAAHRQAMALMTDHELSEAASIFELLRKNRSNDSVYDVYLKRISDLGPVNTNSKIALPPPIGPGKARGERYGDSK